MFLAVWGQVWLLTILGGGACGLVCAGIASVVLFIWTILGGLYLGVFLGLPLGLALAVIVARFATPPHDPVRLARGLEHIGIGITMIITVPLNLYLTGAVFIAGIDHAVVWGLAAIVNGLVAIVAGAVVGRECGHIVSTRHLRRFGLVPPPRRSLLHPRREPAAFDEQGGSVHPPGWSDRLLARIGAPTAGS